jgi:hypothetical protein
MSEVLAGTTPTERDLSRAVWQRSIGMVVLSHMCDVLLDDLTEERIANIVDNQPRSSSIFSATGLTALWQTAYGLARDTHQVPRELHKANKRLYKSKLPSIIEKSFESHTYYKDSFRTFNEGLNAQAFFPLNIASFIEEEAELQGVDGYALNNLNDISNLLRNPSLRDVLAHGAFTANGVWRIVSTDPYHASRGRNPVHNISFHKFPGRGSWFTFPDGNVTMHPQLVAALRLPVALNNAAARPIGHVGPPASLDNRPSSGCPVNHTAPSAVTAEEYPAEIEALSKFLDVEPSHLLRKRSHTPIVALTLRFADVLDKAQESLNRRGVRLDNTMLVK